MKKERSAERGTVRVGRNPCAEEEWDKTSPTFGEGSAGADFEGGNGVLKFRGARRGVRPPRTRWPSGEQAITLLEE